MHAVIVTFNTSAPPESLEEPFRNFAEALLGVDGFVSKVWLNDGETFGGSYVFENEEAAHTYLQSELVAGLTANEAFKDFEVRTFAVIDELTAVTARTPVAT